MTTLGNLRGPILIETTKVTADKLPSALAAVQGCWKSSSFLWMQVNGFPVLPGLVLSGWSQISETAIIQFCRERSISDLLVRIDRPGQRWTRRRGGYTIPLEESRSLVEQLDLDGIVTILLEPASPYIDLFSLTSVCDVNSGKIDLEVVGSGFDASDILRADIVPHERFEVLFDNITTPRGSRANFQITRTYLVDAESYRATVRRRLIKIGARLRNPSFPDELMPPGATDSTLDGLAREATRYLRESRQTALLDHAESYEPLPAQLLDKFLSELLRLFQAVEASNLSWRTFSLAGSFLSEDRLVIWDFFPVGDHDTRTLSDLHISRAVG